MNHEFIEALEELEKEKGIKKDYVIEAIETALVTAYKRNFDAAENVKVVMDKVTGATHIYSTKEVVEVIEDSNLQISLDAAKKVFLPTSFTVGCMFFILCKSIII